MGRTTSSQASVGLSCAGWRLEGLVAVLGGDQFAVGARWLAQWPVGSTSEHTMEFWFRPL